VRRRTERFAFAAILRAVVYNQLATDDCHRPSAAFFANTRKTA